VPGPAAPAELQSALGRWWSEGFEFIFSWRRGALQAKGAGDPAGLPPAIFEPIPELTDEFRTRSGREAGERLRLFRDPATGNVTSMRWATYLFTRTQQTFEGVSPSAP
jgi:hypothetical protein